MKVQSGQVAFHMVNWGSGLLSFVFFLPLGPLDPLLECWFSFFFKKYYF